MPYGAGLNLPAPWSVRIYTITRKPTYRNGKKMPKKITLIVDDEWLEAITKLTLDIYDGEVCEWLSVEEVA